MGRDIPLYQGGNTNGRFVRRAMEILTPSIDILLKESPRKAFSWVVLDPGKSSPHIMHGGVHDGRHDYRALALNKAVQAQRTGLPNRFISAIALPSGDTPYYGSWIEEDLPVGVSGLEPYLDEMISRLLTAAILEFANVEFEKWKRHNPRGGFSCHSDVSASVTV